MAPTSPCGAGSDYAWCILTDHLYVGTPDPGGVFKDTCDDEAGTRGPCLAPDDLLAALHVRCPSTSSSTDRDSTPGVRTAVFTMRDGDGELYYTGLLAYRSEIEGLLSVVTGPLVDFGTPNAGCTSIEYPHHPRLGSTMTATATPRITAASTAICEHRLWGDPHGLRCVRPAGPHPVTSTTTPTGHTSMTVTTRADTAEYSTVHPSRHHLTDFGERSQAMTHHSELIDLHQDLTENAGLEAGLCAQTDPEAFFPAPGGSPRAAKRTCMNCPVRKACLTFALDHDEQFGIWGGLTAHERRRVQRQRKLDETTVELDGPGIEEVA